MALFARLFKAFAFDGFTIAVPPFEYYSAENLLRTILQPIELVRRQTFLGATVMNDVYRNFLTEHLAYEIDMFDWAYKFLFDDGTANARRNQALTNLAIECFWLHARNLIIFFRRPATNATIGEASSSDFTEQRFHPSRAFKEEDEINAQVSHLKYERPSTTEEKLNTTKMPNVHEAIHSIIREWERLMKKDYGDIWKKRSPVTLTITNTEPGATNMITTSSTSTTLLVVPFGSTFNYRIIG